MTCASCAARIEKKLNKIDGVTATVNFATEKARVDYVGDVSPDQLVAAVEQAGYKAELPTPEHRRCRGPRDRCGASRTPRRRCVSGCSSRWR